MHVRRATKEDIDAFSDMTGKPTLKAYVGEIDGRIVALAGLALDKGRWIAFCDLHEDARPFRMTIARTAKRIMAEARASGVRFIYANMDKDEPGACRWLQSLGFAIDHRIPNLYRWRA